jgi:hypothetical protein
MNTPEGNVLDDVRAAKAWVDAQAATIEELGKRLAAVDQAYRSRTGVFASVPLERPEWVQRLIDSAEDEP